MSNKQRHPVLVIAGLVLAMHAAALTLLVSSSVRPSVPPNPGSGSFMQARLVSQGASASAQAPAPASPTAPDASTASSAAPLPLPELVQADHEAAAAAAQDVYIPRPQLSMAPRPSSRVIVPFPKEITSIGRHTAILALFIDETGLVRRVRVDGPSLPKPMEEAARDAFLQAHFSPGEIDGRRVKSLIRIEVVFDNSPIAAAEGPRSL